MSHSRIFYLVKKKDKDNYPEIVENDIFDRLQPFCSGVDYVIKQTSASDIEKDFAWLSNIFLKEYEDYKGALTFNIKNRTITIGKGFKKSYNDKRYDQLQEIMEDVYNGRTLAENETNIMKLFAPYGGFIGVTKENGWIEVNNFEKTLCELNEGETYAVVDIFDYHY